MRFTARTRFTGGAALAGVVGRPIGGSLSPAIHNAWLEAAGLDAVYVPFEAAEGRFEAFLEGLRGVVRGLNVTAPFKTRAFAAADSAEPAARRAGAANVLVFSRDGAIEACNTDGLGVLRALASQAPALRLTGARVAVVGAGGAARGAAASLLEAGAAQVRLVGRDLESARATAGVLGDGARAWPWSRMADAFEGAELMINATPLGGDRARPLEAPLERLASRAVVMDMVYRPLRTALLADAQRLGLTTVDGLAMLVGQAELSFAALFGQAPPATVDARAAALEAALGAVE